MPLAEAEEPIKEEVQRLEMAVQAAAVVLLTIPLKTQDMVALEAAEAATTIQRMAVAAVAAAAAQSMREDLLLVSPAEADLQSLNTGNLPND